MDKVIYSTVYYWHYVNIYKKNKKFIFHKFEKYVKLNGLAFYTIVKYEHLWIQ